MPKTTYRNKINRIILEIDGKRIVFDLDSDESLNLSKKNIRKKIHNAIKITNTTKNIKKPIKSQNIVVNEPEIDLTDSKIFESEVLNNESLLKIDLCLDDYDTNYDFEEFEIYEYE